MSNDKMHRIHLTETQSTNQYAKEMRVKGVTALITADFQSAGRGQRGNTWESERGKNLLFTLAIPMQCITAREQFVISELISVALCDVLSHYTSCIHIKWPNDIYHHNKKLCGILIEHDIEGSNIIRSIIGVGLNVNQTHFMSEAPNPISLSQILGDEVEREQLLETIIERFNELYRQYISPTLPLDRATLHERYTQLLYLKDIQAEYRDAMGNFTAILRDVKPDGRLILEDELGAQRIYLFKEVTYIIPQSLHPKALTP